MVAECQSGDWDGEVSPKPRFSEYCAPKTTLHVLDPKKETCSIFIIYNMTSGHHIHGWWRLKNFLIYYFYFIIFLLPPWYSMQSQTCRSHPHDAACNHQPLPIAAREPRARVRAVPARASVMQRLRTLRCSTDAASGNNGVDSCADLRIGASLSHLTAR